MKERYDAVVVGGGHNGLTAAAVLARAGRKTALVERREQLGGLAAGAEFWPGYRHVGVLHDSGAVRQWIVDDLELDKLGLERQREPTPIFVPEHAAQGEGLLLHRRATEGVEEIAQRSAADAEAYRAYRSFIDILGPWVQSTVDRRPPALLTPGRRDLVSIGRAALGLRRLGRRTMSEVLRVAPMSTADWLGERFASDIVRAGLAAPALFDSGLGPRAPGTNTNLLLDECLRTDDIVGGPAALVTCLESCARQHGVEILTGVAVERIEIVAGTATGVVLDNGERLSTAVVAAACDPKRVFLEMLEPRHLPLRLLRHLHAFRSRGVTAKLHLALNSLPRLACRPQLRCARLRIGSRVDELERAMDAAKYRSFSSEPVLDVRVPSLETSDLAPEGHHVLSVLVHGAPYGLDGGWSSEQSARLSATVVARLAQFMPDIRDTIVGSEILTPLDIESRYATTEGHLFHGEKAIDQLLIRPTPECARYSTPFAGLFLCASGSHGGGGINSLPGVLAGRSIVAAGNRA